MTGNDDGGLATKLIFPLFVLLGLLVMVGVSFWISIFILIFLGAIFLLYENKTEIAQKFPSLSTAKIPSWKTVVVVIVVLAVFAAIGWGISILLQKNPTWEFSEGEEWIGLKHSSGARIENGFLVLAPGAYVKRDISSDNGRAAFKLKNVKLEDGSILQGEIRDKTGRGNGATFFVNQGFDGKVYAKAIYPQFVCGGGFTEQGGSKDKEFSLQQPLNIKGSVGPRIRLLINTGNSILADFNAVAESDSFSITLKNTGSDGEIRIDGMTWGDFY